MSFARLSAAAPGDVRLLNGEHLLLGGTPPGWPGRPVRPAPFYKRRYTWDGDIILGCAIGCRFCYYLWINNTAHTIGTGKKGLVRICEPEEAVAFLEQSRLFLRNIDPLTLCARSDGSMQIEEIAAFLKAFPHRNLVFILHRGYFGPRQLEAWGHDPRAIYCTTITPAPPEVNQEDWTPIHPGRQLAGLRFLLQNGIPPERISVMCGPFNSRNVQAGVLLIKRLGEMGIKFATYRGCSIGSFGVEPDREHLSSSGFLDGSQDERAAPEGHEYYRMKNFLHPDVEEKLLRAGEQAGVRLYRNTGLLYQNEFGIPVAFNRNNRWRRELGQWERVSTEELDQFLRSLGYHPISIRETKEGYLVELPEPEVATEDVAMTVGARFRTSVLFNRHRIAPSLADLHFYAANRLFWPLPDGWEEAVGLALSLAG